MKLIDLLVKELPKRGGWPDAANYVVQDYDVKVAYIGDEGGLREALVFEIKTTKPAWADEFRPLRTEAEKLRDEAGLALYHAINWNAEGEMVSPSRMEDYKKAYDAISAGKIPGVKLEGK